LSTSTNAFFPKLLTWTISLRQRVEEETTIPTALQTVGSVWKPAASD
jgi:hypothetical protein